MKRIFKGILGIIVFSLLTILTQVGGIIWLITIPFWRLLKKKITSKRTRKWINPIFFVGIYLLVSVVIIPPIARHFGRVPMPVFNEANVKPLNYGFCLMNRHYVRPAMRKTVIEVGVRLTEKHPETVLAYMDGNLPFYNGFPLLPHLSHNDGKKLDIALFFKDAQTNKSVNRDAPTWIGYGGSEHPKAGEQNTTLACEKKGYWQYGLMAKFLPLWGKDRLIFDQERTKSMIQLFANHASVGKILLEPHLEARMRLTGYDKVRFHGCHAVRHDDHIHVQL